MGHSWLKSVEQIMLVTVDSNARVLGVLSPDCCAGVSMVCRMLAESFANSGSRTLLIDFTRTVGSNADEEPLWAPGDAVDNRIARSARGFDLLAPAPSKTSRTAFNNVDALKRLLAEDLLRYQRIVIDMPAVLEHQESQINPLPAAMACDATIMICKTGKVTSHRVQEAVQVLRTAGVQLGGVVLNDAENPTLAVELAARSRKFKRYFPRLAHWLKRLALANRYHKLQD